MRNHTQLILVSIFLGASVFVQVASAGNSAAAEGSSNSDDKSQTVQAHHSQEKGDSQGNYILDPEHIPDDLTQFHTQPWNLLAIPKFKRLYVNALKDKKFSPWISKLFVVNSQQENRACKTAEGIVFIYLGSKPHSAEDTIKIGFIPAKNILELRISDGVDRHQTGDYGDVTPLLDSIFNNQICKGN
jgi:hypothetical protein